MGDKSPKSNKKQSDQKKSKDNATQQQKKDIQTLKQVPKTK
jgi:hypothetical protein